MKKLLALSLVLLLSFCSVAAAEGVDLAAMTLDELVDLHTRVDTEIDARISCDPAPIAEGVYEVGKSIKQGMFLITCTDVNSGWGIYIDLFDSMESYYKYKENNVENANLIISRSNFNIGGSAMVQLEEGMVLYIHNGIATAEEVLPSWMP